VIYERYRAPPIARTDTAVHDGGSDLRLPTAAAGTTRARIGFRWRASR
jgi:hypothetical protein